MHEKEFKKIFLKPVLFYHFIKKKMCIIAALDEMSENYVLKFPIEPQSLT